MLYQLVQTVEEQPIVTGPMGRKPTLRVGFIDSTLTLSKMLVEVVHMRSRTNGTTISTSYSNDDDDFDAGNKSRWHLNSNIELITV